MSFCRKSLANVQVLHEKKQRLKVVRRCVATGVGVDSVGTAWIVLYSTVIQVLSNKCHFLDANQVIGYGK